MKLLKLLDELQLNAGLYIYDKYTKFLVDLQQKLKELQ